MTLYGRFAGATGELGPFADASTLEFDDSVGDVLDDLDVAFFASAQMRRDRFVAVAMPRCRGYELAAVGDAVDGPRAGRDTR